MAKQKRKHSAKTDVMKPLPSDELFHFIFWVLSEDWKRNFQEGQYFRIVNGGHYEYATQKQLYEMYLKRGNVS